MKYIKYSLIFSMIFTSFSSFASDARSYNLVPDDTNIFETQYSTIDISQKKVSGVEYKANNQTVYIRDLMYYNLKGNLAALSFILPYSSQQVHFTTPFDKTISTDSVGDAKIMFAMGFNNMPALSKESFSKYNFNGSKSSCSFSITVPSGSYNQLSPLNVGTNRYSAKPECAFSWTENKFETEFYTGFTGYTDNTQYNGNSKLSQDLLYHAELHLSYNFNKSLWSSFDITYLNGGKTSVNSISQNDSQDNTSLGFIVGYNVAPQQYIKIIGQKTISSPDFAPKSTAIGITYQYLIK